MELLLHQWGDWPELYRNTDKTEATEIVIIDSQMNYRGKLDTYEGGIEKWDSLMFLHSPALLLTADVEGAIWKSDSSSHEVSSSLYY